MKSVELFAGAGGLAMGVTLAGFESLAVAEWDRWACDTIRENQHNGYPLVKDWPLWEGDVHDFDWSSIPEGIDLLAGGPPCQPFSMGGQHKAFGDKRDMFPVTVEAVRRLKPKSFLIENVRGLTRTSFHEYFQYIQLQLEFPEVARHNGETWLEHLKRLREEKTSGALHFNGLTYNLFPVLVNAADYGIPQKRERIFIVGFRSDLGVEWSPPDTTHSLDALLYDKWVTGDYWERHRIPKSCRPAVPERQIKRVEKLGNSVLPNVHKPWRTVRDALVDVPDPREEGASFFRDHKFQDGARVYKGHTGSPLDLPSKTLKAGVHGVPGGENMMVCDDGSVRYFTVRESARLQNFPDGYTFHGAWSEAMRQLGNAVPVALARTMACSIAEQLALAQLRNLANEQRSSSRKMA